MPHTDIENEYDFQLPRKKTTVIGDKTYKFVTYLLALINGCISASLILRVGSIGCYTAQSMAAAYYNLFLFIMPIFTFVASIFSTRKHIKKRLLDYCPIFPKDLFNAWLASAISILKVSLFYLIGAFFSVYIFIIAVMFVGFFTVIRLFKGV